MPEGRSAFAYVAIDPAGRRVKGLLSAGSDAAAYERLRRDGLVPVAIRKRRGAASRPAVALRERELAEFLSDLAALLKAGSDMRAALSILGGGASSARFRSLSQMLNEDIAGGSALDAAFNAALGRDHAFVAALVAAGEAAGDIASGLRRASEIMQSRIRLADQLVSVLSYPVFVFLTTIVAVGAILLFVVPSLAPLVEDAGTTMPTRLGVLFALSSFVRANCIVIGGGCAIAAGAILLAGALGLLAAPLSRLALDGPFRRTSSGLIFGGFAVTLGSMLSAGAPMSEALRLAINSVRSTLARQRLQPAAQSVRDGQTLSAALGRVGAFPRSITRLAAVGEASGALGPMLTRAGELEEGAAIRRIEAASRFLGPALIVCLGGMVGLLMAGLLSGVSQIGSATLQ
jgi:type II secretory pathway component PulF